MKQMTANRLAALTRVHSPLINVRSFSVCVEKRQEFSGFGAGALHQKLPLTILYILLALGLPRNHLLGAAGAPCKRIPPV